jgi:hypothetical protein
MATDYKFTKDVVTKQEKAPEIVDEGAPTLLDQVIWMIGVALLCGAIAWKAF